MSYREKLKKENKRLVLENDDLKSELRLQTHLFMKHGLLPNIAMTECLCVDKNRPASPPCAACAARDILVLAGWDVPERKEEKPKSKIIVPSGIITPN